MKEKELQIVCILSDTLRIGLKDVREQRGHDDSLPYSADIYVQNGKPGETEYVQIAEIWNDGWGGESETRKVNRSPENDILIGRMSELCKKHNLLYRGRPVCPYNIKTLCDCMAEGWLFCNEEAKKQTILYRFDDDPVVIKNNGSNLYKFKTK